MARLSVAASNAAIQAVLPVGGTYFISLHSADPGTTGTSEFTTVTRQAYTASTAAGGSVNNTNSIAIPNGNTQSATFVAIWTAVTAGAFVVGAPTASPVTAASVTFAAAAAAFTAS